MKTTAKVLCLTFILSIFVGTYAYAEERQLSRLTDSYLFENLEKDEVWQAEVLENSIKYSCIACDKAISAHLEIVSPYTAENYSSLPERYLSERKVYCMNLVTRHNGRCLETYAISLRGNALKGFRSEQEFADHKEIETIFFYNEKSFGPELLRTIILIEDGTTLPNGTADTFLAHMAKLTLFW
ncbi:hypothetical protein GN278_08440 [Rhodobacteraceae bacterium Araon29]